MKSETAPTGENIFSAETLPFCNQPWSNLFVRATGRIQACCMNSTSLGNITTDAPDEVWNSIALQQMRSRILANDYKTAGCSPDCSYIRHITQHGGIDRTPPEWREAAKRSTSFRNNLARYEESVANRETVARNTPITLDIQPNESCNMACIMCHQKHDSTYRVSPPSLRKLFEYAPHFHSVRFQGGEVFIYTDFTDYLIELKESLSEYQKLNVITNASKLAPELLERLTEGNNPVFFTVSLDTVHEETYRYIRQSKFFGRVIETIRYLGRIQQEKKVPLLSWNFVVMKSNFYHIQEAIELAAELDVEIAFQPIVGTYAEENIFAYRDLRDPEYVSYLGQCIETARALNAKAVNLDTIKTMLDS
ncbi:radical SAM protein [Sulfuricurvum sp. IAE1]|uniref:radical SAM protein n=1 Tax=Sulfuricurvum sp. IAE1 TaxID=2546102 RepID=UPI0010445581|nr:radical SAM protein [Sulfuricurvum sp. IAE1]TDA62663.1 radical SAM protein [Sulfuricurvum sp. IAE1]